MNTKIHNRIDIVQTEKEVKIIKGSQYWSKYFKWMMMISKQKKLLLNLFSFYITKEKKWRVYHKIPDKPQTYTTSFMTLND